MYSKYSILYKCKEILFFKISLLKQMLKIKPYNINLRKHTKYLTRYNTIMYHDIFLIIIRYLMVNEWPGDSSILPG